MEITQVKTVKNEMDSFIDKLLPELEEIYKDIHRNPELSMQEFRTAKIASDYVTKYEYEVTTGIGVTGVVGIMKNGEGPVVMLRADMDALPVTEDTGLALREYESCQGRRRERSRRVACMWPRLACHMADGCSKVIFRTQRSMERNVDGCISTRRGSWPRCAKYDR